MLLDMRLGGNTVIQRMEPNVTELVEGVCVDALHGPDWLTACWLFASATLRSSLVSFWSIFCVANWTVQI